jgi:hypothetical protein
VAQASSVCDTSTPPVDEADGVGCVANAVAGHGEQLYGALGSEGDASACDLYSSHVDIGMNAAMLAASRVKTPAKPESDTPLAQHDVVEGHGADVIAFQLEPDEVLAAKGTSKKRKPVLRRGGGRKVTAAVDTAVMSAAARQRHRRAFVSSAAATEDLLTTGAGAALAAQARTVTLRPAQHVHDYSRPAQFQQLRLRVFYCGDDAATDVSRLRHEIVQWGKALRWTPVP